MDNFDKIRLVGRGAHGSVYLSKQKSDDKMLILKEIPVDQMSAEERQFSLNEAKVLKMLDHPNIIAYYENFLADKTMIIVMEYVEGGTLFDFLQERKGKLLSEEEVLNFFGQMVYTLQHVHGKSILHRDLKSQNILLNKKRSIIKIGDFGISKILSSRSKAYTVVGTPCYISPELCEGKAYNQKSDIWALGCILYELMTLKRPFDATTLPALVMKIMKGSYDPVPDIYSSELRESILPRMLHLDPKQRPTAAQLMCNHLIMRVIFKLYTTIGSIPFPKRSDITNTVDHHNDMQQIKMDAEHETHVICEPDAHLPKANYSVWCFEGECLTFLKCLPESFLKAVAIGLNHTIGLTESGLLVSWKALPAILVNSETETSEIVRPCSFVAYIVDNRVAISIISVVCGNGFTACLADNGVVFTFGKVSSGCLGFVSELDVEQPKVVESLFKYGIKSIACGKNHVLALSDEKELFSWGYGTDGCLGLGETRNQVLPQLVELPSKSSPAKIFCGANSSFVITQNFSLLACGSNRHNKLGLDEGLNQTGETRIFSPVVSQPVSTVKVVAVASGVEHSVVLDENGELYTMGSNRFGQLGWGDTKLFYTMPKRIEMNDIRITQISCGDYFSAAVSANGELYFWGKCPESLAQNEVNGLVLVPSLLKKKTINFVACCFNRCAVIAKDEND